MSHKAVKTIAFWCLLLASTAWADESFPSLKAKDQVYTNVTVTSVTATDIYFTHAQGMASAKLKDLNPELQKHFHFDPVKSAQIEQADIQATADFQAKLAAQKPAKAAADSPNPDYVVPKLYARSLRGQRAPSFQAEKWISAPPDTTGKFVLIDLWLTSSEPSRQSIPLLNTLHRAFSDRLVIIGVSDETEDTVRSMTSPVIEYALAIDTQSRIAQSLQLTAVPHCILIDPAGIVRFEGNPLYLNETIVEHYLDKYLR
jgi:cytochrome c biogenesis protein CcmG/thiol:disulfide interchange protein DsbE